jgi:hypothetical protein
MPLPLQLRKVSSTVWELPVSYKEGMRVPARIIASESLLGGAWRPVYSTRPPTIARHTQLLMVYAGRTLVLWLPNRRGGDHGPVLRCNIARRDRFRHQLRHASRTDVPD